jgi:ribosomal-protein-alanine N-acetyltransferase
MLPEIIKTERLTLRPYRLQDVDDVFSYASDPKWARFLPMVPQPYTEEDAEKFIAGQILLDKETHPFWAIEQNEVVIGGLDLRFDFEHQVGELGYSLAQTHWGKGFVAEAAGAVIDAAFSAYPELNRIRAWADSRNAGSLRVMEKLGMVREGVLRQNHVNRGEFIDQVWCGILRSEWEGQKKTR